jgi:predicted dienelactone hydrolase
MKRFLFCLSLVVFFVLNSQHSAFSLKNTEVLLPRSDGKQTPVRLYGNWKKCLPTMILSHGMGGDNSGLAYLANAGVTNGYRVAVMSHTETGKSALRSILFTRKSRKEQALLNPVFWQGRFDDIQATLNYATKNCRPPQLVLGGHSMGSATTMLEAGAKGAVNFGGKNRFDAYVALSPQGISWMFKDEKAWQAITKPVIYVTGTKDSMFNDDYTNRIKAFDYLPKGYKRLVVIKDADHMDFGGRGDNKPAQMITAMAIFDYLKMLKSNSWRAVSYPNTTVKDK